MKAIVYVVTTILVVFYSSSMNGLALSKLWSWFIVNGLGAPEISIPTAIGIALAVTYLTDPVDMDKKPVEKTFSQRLMESFFLATFKPMCFLAMGIIVKQFL